MYRKILVYSAIIFGVAINNTSAQVKNDNYKEKDSLKNVKLSNVDVYGSLKQKNRINLVSKKQLESMQENTLGGTLSNLSGIQNSYFGPHAGLPVIRSLSGNRVKILADGLAINDLSGISPNFNVNFNQQNIKNIEVYKASGAVLYGGKAIGGAVNMNTNIIPTTIAAKKISAEMGVTTSINNGVEQSFSLKGNNSKNFSWHIGGVYNENDEVKIPGKTKPNFVYDPKIIGFDVTLQGLAQINAKAGRLLNITYFPYISQYVLDHLGDPDYGLSEDDKYTFKKTYFDKKTFRYKLNPKNKDYIPGQDASKRYITVIEKVSDIGPTEEGLIPNSHSRGYDINAGVNYIKDNFSVGIGYQKNYAKYGVPAFATITKTPAHSHGGVGGGRHHNHKPVLEYVPISVRNNSDKLLLQTEFSGEAPVMSSVQLNVLGELSNNKELLGSELENEFKTKRGTARLEFYQKDLGFLNGMVGASYDYRKIEGNETLRYMPNNFSEELGFFTLQVLKYQFLQADLGYRYDEIRREANATPDYKKGRGIAGGNLSKRHFALHQATASLQINVHKNVYIKGVYNHSERAPEVNELYAGNIHYAIVIEENGDDQLEKEIANTVELSAGINLDNISMSTNLYKTTFNNYIYLGHTSITRNQFLVKEWRAADTEITGIESEVAYRFDLNTLGKWQASYYYDLVKNKDISGNKMRRFSNGDYMPNMPTSRFGFGLKGQINKLTVNAGLDYYVRQKYLGKHINDEHALPPYELLNAKLSYNFKAGKWNNDIYIYGNNLLDEEARPQNSLLKYLAPLPGIDVGIGIKLAI